MSNNRNTIILLIAALTIWTLVIKRILDYRQAEENVVSERQFFNQKVTTPRPMPVLLNTRYRDPFASNVKIQENKTQSKTLKTIVENKANSNLTIREKESMNPSLQLLGTITNGTEYLCFIRYGGQTYNLKEGDSIAEAVVKGIKAEEVVLNSRKGEIRIKKT